jgi:hypothetical protein
MVGWRPHVNFHLWKLKFKKGVYNQVELQQMQCCQPYDCSWNAWNELYDKWISYSTICLQTWYVVQFVD